MKLRRAFLRQYHGVFGDCDDCGHSVVYHLPLVGCTKCGCDEFH